jgi:hypothetical protein
VVKEILPKPTCEYKEKSVWNLVLKTVAAAALTGVGAAFVEKHIKEAKRNERKVRNVKALKETMAERIVEEAGLPMLTDEERGSFELKVEKLIGKSVRKARFNLYQKTTQGQLDELKRQLEYSQTANEHLKSELASVRSLGLRAFRTAVEADKNRERANEVW